MSVFVLIAGLMVKLFYSYPQHPPEVLNILFKPTLLVAAGSFVLASAFAMIVRWRGGVL
jgi:hypothetical protein